MKTVHTLARILLGLIFTVLGLNGFFFFIKAAVPPGMAGEYFQILIGSHLAVLVFGVQVISGLMLLTNQFVSLALVLLGAVLANILAFHILMYPQGLPLALVTTLLWFFVAWPLRSHFALLFARKVP